MLYYTLLVAISLIIIKNKLINGTVILRSLTTKPI